MSIGVESGTAFLAWYGIVKNLLLSYRNFSVKDCFHRDVVKRIGSHPVIGSQATANRPHHRSHSLLTNFCLKHTLSSLVFVSGWGFSVCRLSISALFGTAAAEALNTLKPSDITVVKSMKNPPQIVKTVMSSVCVMLDIKPDKVKTSSGKMVGWVGSRSLSATTFC